MPELVEHLVVGLLRDEGLVARGSSRRLLGEARARVVEEAGELLRRQLAVPARAQDRVVEEDPAADVGVDQTLVPAGGVAELVLPALADPDRAEERAQVARAEGEHADRDRGRHRRA